MGTNEIAAALLHLPSSVGLLFLCSTQFCFPPSLHCDQHQQLRPLEITPLPVANSITKRLANCFRDESRDGKRRVTLA